MKRKNKKIRNGLLLLSMLFVIALNACGTVIKKQGEERKTFPEINRKKAMELFIAGNVKEAKGAVAAAILDYQDALRFDTSAGIYYSLAKAYLKLNKLFSAMENIRKALRQDSLNTEYLNLLGEIYSYGRFPDSAAAVYEKIIRLDSTNYRAYYLLGELYEYDKPLKALGIFERLLKITGPDWNVLLKIAEINERLGRVEKTIETIEKLRQVNPTDLKIQKILIDAYVKHGDLDKALRITDDALVSFPRDLALIEFKANILFREKKFKEAAQEYAKLIRSKKISYEAKLRIASMFLEGKEQAPDLKLAEELFEEIARDSTGWEVNAYLAEIKLQEKEDSLAIEYFEKAAKQAEWNTQIWDRLANVLFVQQQYEKIIEKIAPAAENFPEDFFLNLIVGLAYSQQGNDKEAKKYLMRAVELNPNDAVALTSLGFTLNRLKETDAAVVYLERSLKIQPDDVQTLGVLGLIYDDKKEYEKCDKVYRKALQIDSTNALLLNNYAYSLAERGIKLAEALQMSKKALTSEPENPSYLDTYGWILFRLGKYDSAKVYIQKALDKEKSNEVILEHLGDVYLKLGNKKRALFYWEKALKRNPKNEALKKKIKEGKI